MTRPDFDSARESARKQVEQLLEAARAELEELDERREELLEEIGAAETWLSGGSGGAIEVPGQTTLHEAMSTVLRAGGRPMRAPEIAEEINKRHLYRMRDGRPVHPQQIHARVYHYPQLFTRGEGQISLLEASQA